MYAGTTEQKQRPVEAEGQLKPLPLLLPTIFFDMRSVFKLKACKVVLLADQQTPRIVLTLPHRQWIRGSCLRTWLFTWLGIQTHDFLASTLLAEPSSRPPHTSWLLSVLLLTRWHYGEGLRDLKQPGRGGSPYYVLRHTVRQADTKPGKGEGCRGHHLRPFRLCTFLPHIPSWNC